MVLIHDCFALKRVKLYVSLINIIIHFPYLENQNTKYIIIHTRVTSWWNNFRFRVWEV